jgi:CRISPR-associated protein Csm2
MVNFSVDHEAENLAQYFVTEKITSAQFRKFYNDFKTLERKYKTKSLNNESKENAFISILPQVKLVKAKVSYAKGRKTVPESFERWLKDAVDAINDYQHFEDFLLHFEAVLGYAYGNGLKD